MRKKRSRREGQKTPLGKILTTLMAEKGIGVREAAKIAGVSSSTLVDWRSGVASTDYLALKRLTQALGVSLCYLLTGEDDASSEGRLTTISQVFDDGGPLFDGYARIRIERLIPKATKPKKEEEI